MQYFEGYVDSFYGLAADRQEYCFTKDFFSRSIVLQKI